MSKTIDEIKTQLTENGVVQVRGFGTFRMKDVPARSYLNPATGEKVAKPAHRKLTFKPSKQLVL